MRKKLLLVVVVLLVSSMIVTPGLAVKYGGLDNGEHPYVGLIVFYYPDGSAAWRCSGTLISPRVVVTAAHCTELNGKARIYFDEDVDTLQAQGIYPYHDSANSYTGKAYTSPWWQGALYLPNTGDVGVVVLNKAVTTVDTSNLPTLAPSGYLDQLATQRGLQDVSFTVVGYGLQSVKPIEIGQRVRMKAEVQLVSLKSDLTDGYNLQTTNDPGLGTGPGGTCFGDSGGPIFNAANQIVAVNSFVLNVNCSGASFGYRLDRSEVHDWVYSFVK